jgi:hypothetical protein
MPGTSAPPGLVLPLTAWLPLPECSTFVSAMDRAYTYTVADLASDEEVRLRCDCRVRAYRRCELAALVGWDARLHLVGLHRPLWCSECGEPPFHGWTVSAVPSRS